MRQKNAFNPKVNPYFKHGDAVRWIALNDSGETVGRIAAFYDTQKEEADYVRSGVCGFFESIDDRQVAFLLFDTAKAWLQENGYEAMTGPINFGENDTNWGCRNHSRNDFGKLLSGSTNGRALHTNIRFKQHSSVCG